MTTGQISEERAFATGVLFAAVVALAVVGAWQLIQIERAEYQAATCQEGQLTMRAKVANDGPQVWTYCLEGARWQFVAKPGQAPSAPVRLP